MEQVLGKREGWRERRCMYLMRTFGLESTSQKAELKAAHDRIDSISRQSWNLGEDRLYGLLMRNHALNSISTHIL